MTAGLKLKTGINWNQARHFEYLWVDTKQTSEIIFGDSFMRGLD